MTPVVRRCATLASACRWVLVPAILLATPAAAQTVATDTARVTYRTREVVFFAAGREQGVAVGDSVDVLLDSAGTHTARAVVLSTAQRSASARLLDASTAVPSSARVAYLRRTVDAPAVLTLASPDTAAAVYSELDATASVLPVSHAAGRPISGGLHLDQFNSTSGTILSSGQTTLGVSLDVPFGEAMTIRVRTTSRYRTVSTGMVATGVTTIPYQVELRLEPAGSAVHASLGRFLATEALALGYLDGARLELRPGSRTRFGVAAGVVPNPVRLQFSTLVKRAGAWWGLQGSSAYGTVSVAADWSQGAIRRTIIGLQTGWSPAPRVSFSFYGDADMAAAWDTTRSGARLTSAFANVHLPLPAGFRLGLGAETYTSVRRWETVADTFALPGRYTGVNMSLGHDVAGFAVDANGSALQRESDPAPILRGMLTMSRGLFFAVASGERGPFGDYMYVTGRFTVTPASSPVSLAIGGLYGITAFQAGGLTIRRYSLRPDLSWRAGRGLLFNAGADVGRYNENTTTYLHAGVSYYFH